MVDVRWMSIRDGSPLDGGAAPAAPDGGQNSMGAWLEASANACLKIKSPLAALAALRMKSPCGL